VSGILHNHVVSISSREARNQVVHTVSSSQRSIRAHCSSTSLTSCSIRCIATVNNKVVQEEISSCWFYPSNSDITENHVTAVTNSKTDVSRWTCIRNDSNINGRNGIRIIQLVIESKVGVAWVYAVR